MLSVIIPAFNEQENVGLAACEILSTLGENKIDCELIFVDDGSKDGTWDRLTCLAASDEKIKAVKLSRNFGKESAIFAGLENARGEACAVMDCDLQHPVRTLVEMYRVWEKGGVDVVEAKKSSRGDETAAHRFFARLFYNIIDRVSGLEMRDSSDFKLLDRKAVDALLSMPERLTFFRAMSSWVGFNSEMVTFDVEKRASGQSKFSFGSLCRYAVNNITSYTSSPMQLVTVAGVVTFIIAVIFGINTLVNKFTGHSREGFPTVILLILITSSIIMFSLGIIGCYLSKIYEEIKARPRYLVSEKLNFENEKK